MTDTLQGLVEEAKNFVRAMYADADADYQVPPTWIAKGPEGVAVVMTPFDDTEGKRSAVNMIRMLFAAKDITHYVLVTEAWMANVNPEKEPELVNIPPSQREDRKEVVNIVGADRSGNKIGVTYEILRNDDMTPRLGDTDLLEAQGVSSIGGVMVSMLEDLPPLQDEFKARINELLDRHAAHSRPGVMLH